MSDVRTSRRSSPATGPKGLPFRGQFTVWRAAVRTGQRVGTLRGVAANAPLSIASAPGPGAGAELRYGQGAAVRSSPLERRPSDPEPQPFRARTR